MTEHTKLPVGTRVLRGDNHPDLRMEGTVSRIDAERDVYDVLWDNRNKTFNIPRADLGVLRNSTAPASASGTDAVTFQPGQRIVLDDAGHPLEGMIVRVDTLNENAWVLFDNADFDSANDLDLINFDDLVLADTELVKQSNVASDTAPDLEILRISAEAAARYVNAFYEAIERKYVYVLHHYGRDDWHGAGLAFNTLEGAQVEAARRYKVHGWATIADLIKSKKITMYKTDAEREANEWWPLVSEDGLVHHDDEDTEHAYIVRQELGA